MLAIKRATKVLEKELDRLRRRRKNQSDSQETNGGEDANEIIEVEVPLEFYQNRIMNNVKPAPIVNSFRSTALAKIDANIDIIERMLFEDNWSIEYVSRWLMIPSKMFIRYLQRYFKSIQRYHNTTYDKKMKLQQRMMILKDCIELHMRCNMGQLVTIKSAMDAINSNSNDDTITKYKYNEVRACLKNIMGYSWRKSNERPPSFLNRNSKEEESLFKSMISKLEDLDYLIVYVDECSFNIKQLPLYSWMKKGEPPSKIIRGSSKTYNTIAAQWKDEVFFIIKEEYSNGDQFAGYLKLLHSELQTRVAKAMLTKRTVLVFDNSGTHRTDRVMDVIKDLRITAFSIPPYQPESNKIEGTFGRLKTAISRRNLANKQFYAIIKEEIKRL